MAQGNNDSQNKPGSKSTDSDLNEIAKLNTPPHSMEAEQAVLGSIMQSVDAWDKIAEILIQEDFYNRSHRMIFSAITRLIAKNSAADPITLKDELETNNELEDVGGFSYIVNLARNTPSSSNITAYANIVRERAVVRELIGAANDIADVSFNPEGRDSKELLDLAETKVFEIAEKRTAANEGPISVKGALRKTIARIEELSGQDRDVTGVSTGFTDLDKKTSGMQPSDLIIVAARPSMGKCIVSGSKLVNPITGEMTSIDDMVKNKQGLVTALSDSFKLQSTHATHFVDDGVKPVFKVTTALGRTIETTITHPFLTGEGWQPLADIKVGEQIAVPRILPIFGDTLLSKNAVLALAEKSLSVKDKHVLPEVIFTLQKPLMALFLSNIFAHLGKVFASENENSIILSSTSYQFACTIQHLLLRFGIIAHLRDAGDISQSTYEVKISHIESVLVFISHIGIADKSADLANIKQNLKIQDLADKAEQEPLPQSISTYINSLTDNLNKNISQISRAKVVALTEVLDDNYLSSLAQSDIYWDEIISIEATGAKQVYDLTIPDLHNFIAQDICVHNTTFAMNLVENALLLEEKPVLVFSLEMPSEQIMMRMLASLSRVNQTSIRTAKLEDADWARINSSVKMLSDKDNLFIDDSSGLTPMEVRTRARKLARDRGGISMIMVDYLQLMRVPSLSDNRTLEISEISRSLKALAKELQCPVIALSQLNRGLEQRADKRPINSDLRESGAIEQDADLIMFIYRDEVYNESSDLKGIAEIIIGKQRNGPIGTTRLTFQGQFSRFDNYSGPAYDDE